MEALASVRKAVFVPLTEDSERPMSVWLAQSARPVVAAAPVVAEAIPPALLQPVRIVACGEEAEVLHVEDVEPGRDDFIEQVTDRTDALAQQQGGRMPLVAAREVVANLLHAHFACASIVVMSGASKVIIADRGPGIQDPQRALLAGYSTATAAQRQYMRATGMGLPLAQAAMARAGGRIAIDSNLSHGTVVSLDLTPGASATGQATATRRGRLSDRDKRVLSVLSELGSAGPSIIARDLVIPLSTAHRVLTRLEQAELVVRDAKGKRRLTDKGIHQVGLIFAQ